MASSFLGQSLRVKLQSGDSVQGKITSIDALTGSLGLLKLDGRFQSLSRGDIVDLEILPQTAAAPAQSIPLGPSSSNAASSRPALGDPAIVSYNHPQSTYASKLNAEKAAIEIPRAPAAMLTKAGEASSMAKNPRMKAKSRKGVIAEGEFSPHVQTEEENGYGSGRQVQPKNKRRVPKRATHVSSTEESDLEQDFDFDKALQSFDKRKIWQEIKTKDQTDPKSLLVSHNRLNGSERPMDGSTYRGRSGQEKLGLHEPVLSPSPTSSQPALPVLETSVSLQGDQSKMQEELERLRGTALQKEVENGQLNDELRRLKSQIIVLEALGGVELQHIADTADGYKWKGTIYESLSAHAEARRVSEAAAKGSLTFLLKTFIGDAAKLRYLGLAHESSDDAVIERLPPQYKNEMGLKAESASIFVRRIKEAIQPK